MENRNFIGKFKMFELALQFFEVGFEESFDRLKNVSYEFEYGKRVDGESLRFYLDDLYFIGFHRDSYDDGNENFCVVKRKLDGTGGSAENYIFCDGEFLPRIMFKNEEKTEELPFGSENEQEAENCKSCLCSDCMTRTRMEFPCHRCPKCEEEFEENGYVLPVNECITGLYKPFPDIEKDDNNEV